MNFIKHYRVWREFVGTDQRVTAQHMTLYLTLFDYWNVNRFQNPIAIIRTDVMLRSRIRSEKTYVKYLRDLEAWGYIQYHPAFHSGHPSIIYLNALGQGDMLIRAGTQAEAGAEAGTETDAEADTEADAEADTEADAEADTSLNKTYTNNSNFTNALDNLNHGPSTGNKNCIDKRNREAVQPGANTGDHHPLSKEKKAPGVWSRGVVRKEEAAIPTIKGYPEAEEVQEYFNQEGSTAIEAKTFYSHYKAMGWKVKGEPVEHWQSLADKWMINEQKNAANKPKPKTPAGRLTVELNQDYTEHL